VGLMNYKTAIKCNVNLKCKKELWTKVFNTISTLFLNSLIFMTFWFQ
jgi:hypothetical protein